MAQELLRHASVATTALYTQVDDTERRAAILALPA
jgi:site-specific recombinase XerD